MHRKPGLHVSVDFPPFSRETPLKVQYLSAMCPRPMSWPEPSTAGVEVSSRAAKFDQSLKQHVRDGLTPELALDLVLNELVVAAAKATHASAAAVALARGDEMVCRATTGDHAPDLGIPIHTRTGLSGACVRSRSPQNCRDTELDERVDSDVSRRLGIRSILVVPILEGEQPAGIIEVFSAQPEAFSKADELQLQEFALDSLKLRQLSVEIAQRPLQKLEDSKPIERPAITDAKAIDRDNHLAIEEVPLAEARVQDFRATSNVLTEFPRKRNSRTDLWTVVLAALVTVAAFALLFLIGYRTGWLRVFSKQPARVVAPQPPPQEGPPAAAAEPSEPEAAKDQAPKSQAVASAAPINGGLVIYERGKVIYRLQPTPSKSEAREPPAAVGGTHKVPHVWLAPAVSEARLRDRVEPEYPEQARAAGRSGNVILEILVRKDGSVASVRRRKGDPVLAEAAAAAVRNWHYEPYQLKGQAREFQTDVTLKFSLSQ